MRLEKVQFWHHHNLSDWVNSLFWGRALGESSMFVSISTYNCSLIIHSRGIHWLLLLACCLPAAAACLLLLACCCLPAAACLLLHSNLQGDPISLYHSPASRICCQEFVCIDLCHSKSSLCALPRLLLTKSPNTDETGCAMAFSFKYYVIVCAKWALYQ